MMRVKFYVATMADAIGRAQRIAPNKGAAYDKAHGLVLEIRADGHAEVRSTNLEVYYREKIKDVVDVFDFEGDDPVLWRLPSTLLHGIMQGLPVQGELEMECIKDVVHMTCGKKVARLRVAARPEDFPQWNYFDNDTPFVDAEGLGARVQQVAWATSKDGSLFSGINFNGERLAATDKYSCVTVPMDIDLGDNTDVTVPLSILSGILSNLPGDMSMRIKDGHMHLRIGEEIEVTSMVLQGKYPNLGLLKSEGYKHHVKLPREQVQEAITAQMVLVKNERYPRMSFLFDNNEMKITMSSPEVGDMADVVECSYEDEPFEVHFTPDFVASALTGTDAPSVDWYFDGMGKASHITDAHGYRAWVQSRSTTDPKEV